MKKLLWVGDGPDCPSGFGLATRKTLETVAKSYDVTVLGINHRGDPGTVPYPVYTAAVGGDYLGVGRLQWMCELVKPDVIVLQNDPWNLPFYIEQLKPFANVPVIASVAVDGKNLEGKNLDGLALAIFWTQFGLDEARAGGYVGPGAVIPLGVDLDAYHPLDKLDARSRRLPKDMDDAFLVGNVNRNQPRKRWDLTIKYFAEWIISNKIRDAFLYLHTAPTGDTGVDVIKLAKYYGVLDRLALMQPPTWYGIPEHEMRDTYNCFDVQVSTTQGEGFGLTTLEGMACGIPQIVPDWAALGNWAKDAAWLVKCSSTAIGPPYQNVIGGVVDQGDFIHALNSLYRSVDYRRQNGAAALECAQRGRYRWDYIGQKFTEAIDKTLSAVDGEEAWRDLGRPIEVSA